MDLPPLNIGDVLILRSTGSRKLKDRDVTVTKIGRKWGYAVNSYGQPIKFDLESGAEDAGQYSSQQRVLTAEMAADEEQRHEVVKSLRQAGLRFDYGQERHFTTEALERIVIVVRDGRSTEGVAE